MMLYKDRNTGKLMGATEARARRGMVAVPVDPSRWKKMAFDAMGVDPVIATPRPSVDSYLYKTDGSTTQEIDGKLYQKWVVEERGVPIESRRDRVYGELQKVVDEIIESRVLVVNGVPIKANTVGLSRVNGAKNAGRSKRTYVFGNKHVVELSQVEVDGLFTAIDDFFEAVYSNQAAIISQVAVSDNPETVDLNVGWPNGD